MNANHNHVAVFSSFPAGFLPAFRTASSNPINIDAVSTRCGAPANQSVRHRLEELEEQ